MYKKIIVPIIKSEYSEIAETFAFNFASAILENKMVKDLKLVGMHVLDDRIMGYEFGNEVEHKLKEIGKKTLVRFKHKAQTMGLADHVDAFAHDGIPAENIINYARSTRADLIIMGERVENTFLDNPLMGGTTEIVIRKATCPVLISRFKCMKCDDYKCYQSEEPSVYTCKQFPGFKRILFPYDGSPQAKHAVKHAIYWATTWDSRLTVLYVGGSMRILDKLKQQLDKNDNLDVEYRLETKDLKTKVATKIVEVEKQINAHLIVMGAFGDPHISEILLGSTTARTTRNASCPVLLIR